MLEECWGGQKTFQDESSVHQPLQLISSALAAHPHAWARFCSIYDPLKLKTDWYKYGGIRMEKREKKGSATLVVRRKYVAHESSSGTRRCFQHSILVVSRSFGPPRKTVHVVVSAAHKNA